MTCSGAAAVAVAGGRLVATTATVTVGTSSAPTMHPTTTSSSSGVMKEEWRRYGVSRRKQLVEKDEKDGGTSFDLHKKCPIQRYFQIADRVVSDFRSKCADPTTDVEETYVMGHRLVAFLGKALPQHPDYRKPAVAELCKQSAQDLDWIRLRMQEIALKIDEEQLNLYITMDFEPQLEDDSSVSSEEADTGFADFSKVNMKELKHWEDFSGWAFQDDAPSTATETNLSSSSSKSQEANTSTDESEPKTDVSGLPQFDFDAGSTTALGSKKAKMEKSSEDEEADEPHAYVKFHDDEVDNDDGNDDDDEDDDDDDDGRYRFVLSEEEGLAASILQTIAGEEVHYETDSEAVDSWAQDGESGTVSGASSGTTLTYDPARIAFREIMNRLPQDKYTPRSLRTVSSSSSPPSPPPPPPPPVPTNTLSSSEDDHKTVEEEASNRDHWASFDFASARRQARLTRLRNRTKETARS